MIFLFQKAKLTLIDSPNGNKMLEIEPIKRCGYGEANSLAMLKKQLNFFSIASEFVLANGILAHAINKNRADIGVHSSVVANILGEIANSGHTEALLVTQLHKMNEQSIIPVS